MPRNKNLNTDNSSAPTYIIGVQEMYVTFSKLISIIKKLVRVNLNRQNNQTTKNRLLFHEFFSRLQSWKLSFYSICRDIYHA